MSTRLHITCDLVVETPLHIGGTAPEAETIDGERREYAPMIRGAGGKPVIPGASLKGVLRSLLPSDDAESWLGHITDHSRDSGGQISRLWLGQAFLKRDALEGIDGLSPHKPTDHGFKKVGVALNADRASAEDNQLFTREHIPAGAVFGFRATWFGDANDAALHMILKILSGGIRVGTGTGKGAGRVALDLVTLAIERDTIGEDGIPAKEALDDAALAHLIRSVNAALPKFRQSWTTRELTLSCDGPFISVRGADKQGDDAQKTLPLEQDGKPVLWPDSLKGALRSRARWIEELRRARGESALGRAEALPMDDRKLEEVLGGRRFPKAGDLAKLSAVERLFGVTGLRGKLEVAEVACTRAGDTQDMKSVSLDRISGGGRSGALFTETVFWGPAFKAVLHLRDPLEEDEEMLWSDLLESLKAEGLELGHGGAKGFGWFDVVQVDGEDKE